ncbi:MAG: hypothetical protein J6E42_03915 [Firmicutes bacterium]|nr:hypothetical protein [Bacillota bacterium]
MKKTSKLLILAGAIGAMAGVVAAMKGKAEEELRRTNCSEVQNASETPDETDTSDEAEVAEEPRNVGDVPELAEAPGVLVTTVVKVLARGPRTANVWPTEEEEKELLRQKLERTIRF